MQLCGCGVVLWEMLELQANTNTEHLLEDHSQLTQWGLRAILEDYA